MVRPLPSFVPSAPPWVTEMLLSAVSASMPTEAPSETVPPAAVVTRMAPPPDVARMPVPLVWIAVEIGAAGSGVLEPTVTLPMPAVTALMP